MIYQILRQLRHEKRGTSISNRWRSCSCRCVFLASIHVPNDLYQDWRMIDYDSDWSWFIAVVQNLIAPGQKGFGCHLHFLPRLHLRMEAVAQLLACLESKLYFDLKFDFRYPGIPHNLAIPKFSNSQENRTHKLNIDKQFNVLRCWKALYLWYMPTRLCKDVLPKIKYNHRIAVLRPGKVIQRSCLQTSEQHRWPRSTSESSGLTGFAPSAIW